MRKLPAEAVLPGMEELHPWTRQWFVEALQTPTEVQRRAWPLLAAGRSALLLAPTGSGKTLAAFLAAIDRLMFSPSEPSDASGAVGAPSPGVRVLYVSPLKALAVDVDRNLRTPLAGIQVAAQRGGATPHVPTAA
ncbi:MAG TPA: DEAD/DEAH box helicase, partial [Lacipirellulaceae bacterium]|nr:DEAD/DEAH box helicase [Lacipirellulaceae bacterium]